MRVDGRKNNEIRNVKIQRNFVGSAEGSVLISMGNTRVICTASIEERVKEIIAENLGNGCGCSFTRYRVSIGKHIAFLSIF